MRFRSAQRLSLIYLVKEHLADKARCRCRRRHLHLSLFNATFKCRRIKCRLLRTAFTAHGGGATRDRTADLLNANQALSQLSYSPVISMLCFCALLPAYCLFRSIASWSNLVGLGRLELPTSPLSGVRSNQLSYRPVEKISRTAHLILAAWHQPIDEDKNVST